MFENGGRGIGDKGKDNGLLIVVAVEDRQVRIEVGYDLEQFITDGFAGETIRDVMRAGVPQRQLRRRACSPATTRIINRIAEGRGVTLQDVPADARRRAGGGRGGSRSGSSSWIFIVDHDLQPQRRRPARGSLLGRRAVERLDRAASGRSAAAASAAASAAAGAAAAAAASAGSAAPAAAARRAAGGVRTGDGAVEQSADGECTMTRSDRCVAARACVALLAARAVRLFL